MTVHMIEQAESRLALVDLGSQIRAKADGTGAFEGWACRYGEVDSYGTTFVPGCFSAGTDLAARSFPLLWMHDPRVVLGVFTAEERDQGLWIAGAYDADPEAQKYRAKAQSGSAPGLSVGFVRLIDPEDPDWTNIKVARLVETSQITLGMQAVPGSELTAVRAAIQVATADRVEQVSEARSEALSSADEALLWAVRLA